MNVLVTGATGFVGRHLVPALVEAGHAVTAVVRRPGALEPREGVEVAVADLARPLEAGALPPTDTVVHLAQANVRFPEGAGELYAVNTVATQGLLDHARRTRATRFLLTSTGNVYGFAARPFAEDDPLVPHDFYALTKIHAEGLVTAYRPFFSTAILRLFGAYGPGQEGRLIPALVGRVREGRPVTLNGGGEPRTNPIYVDDLARAVVAAVERDDHLVANVGGDEAVGIRELAERIGAALGIEARFEQESPEGPGDVVGDTRRLHELFDLRPLLGLEEGLRRTVAEPVRA